MTYNILNFPEYTIANIEECEHDYRINASINIAPDRCPECRKSDFVGFGKREETILDTPIHGKRVGISIIRRRYRCQNTACGRTFYEDIPHRDDKRLATKRLIAYIEKQSLSRTFASLADETGLDEKTIRNIFRDYINRLEKQVRFETPRCLGIDEIHIIRKPRCVISNIEQRTIVDLLTNRNKATVAKYLSVLPGTEKVQLVAIDMWRPYKEAVNDLIPHAKIVIDKFHVVRMANVAMESARKAVRADLSPKHRRGLMHDRFVLLKRRGELTMPEEISFSTWTKNFPVLGMAYEAKEAFFDLWNNTNRAEAEKGYQNWAAALPVEIIPHFEPIITAVRNWHKEIFAYFDNPITNAYAESLNNLIRIMNRLGRGYSFEALRAKVLFTEGVQKVKRPSYRSQRFAKHDRFAIGYSTGREFYPQEREQNFGADISTLIERIEAGDF